MKKFRNKYRISSTRLQNWDYSWAGAYFITICTKNRQHYFGKIQNGKMKLSNIGILADVLLCEIKNHSKNIELGEFVVMPNHIHLILILNGDGVIGSSRDVACNVSTNTTGQSPLPKPQNKKMSKISPKPGSVSTIIRSYKSAVTKNVHRLGFEFQWQPRFHDHIIRNEESFNIIANYIKQNPTNWEKDKFYE